PRAQAFHDLVDFRLVKIVDELLQLRFAALFDVLGIHLLQRAAEVDLGLHAPRRPREELGLDRELLRTDVERVDAAHGRRRGLGHRYRSRRTERRHFASARDSIWRTRSRDNPRISPMSRRVSSSSWSTP